MTFAIKEEGGIGANAIRFFLNNLLKNASNINKLGTAGKIFSRAIILALFHSPSSNNIEDITV